jgi:tRNA(Ile)-lysidine synthase
LRPLLAYPDTWRARWSHLARAVALRPTEPALLALSGGADSVLLFHLLIAASEAPAITAVHVHHGLRGAEADRDADFCAELCREHGVPLRVRRIQLDPDGPSLEARARTERYRVLVEEARRARVRTILTAHHADDGIETLVLRWVRGSDLAGLDALRPRLARGAPGAGDVLVVRPLLGMRRAEIVRLLESAGLAWCEDASNADERFTRNRVRNSLLPRLREIGGPAALERLREFGRAVEELERELARRTAEVTWETPPAAAAHRSAGDRDLGGRLARATLMRLPLALRRRALWRLVLEGTGRAPRKRLLDLVLDDLERGRCGRHSLPRGFELLLRAGAIELHPPAELLGASPIGAARQPWLPFAELAGERALPAPRTAPWLASISERELTLPVPGSVTLADGRRIRADLVERAANASVPRERGRAELDARGLPDRLTVRWPRRGERVHALGAPGSKPLRRLLAEAGVPRAERRRVPLVCAGNEVLWIAGLRPTERARVQPSTRLRLALEITDGARSSAAATDAASAERAERRAAAAPAQSTFWPDV